LLNNILTKIKILKFEIFLKSTLLKEKENNYIIASN